jgi:hypothetical protein
MARPRKVPAVLIEATIRRNAKLASLPSDTARLGYFYLLGDAKLSEPVPGQFASKAVFRDVAGRWARFLDDYIKVGLLEVAPRTCAKCKAAWSSMPPRSGALVVHDWQEHQYDPRKLERQREYEDRQRAERDAEALVSDGVSDAQSDAVSDEFPTGDSRGRARDRAPNVERRTEKTIEGSPDVESPRNGRATRQVEGFTRVGEVASELAEQSGDWTQSLTLAERDEWSGFGPEWDAFRSAWLERGFRHPPHGSADDDPDAPSPSQRALLYSVLDAWPTELPRWIAEAPKGLSSSQVVAHVIDRWHGKRDEGVERASRQETAAAEAKRAEAEPPKDRRVSAMIEELSQ